MHHACMPRIMYMHLYILKLIACAVHPTSNAVATITRHPSQFCPATMAKRQNTDMVKKAGCVDQEGCIDQDMAMIVDQEGCSPTAANRGKKIAATHQQCGSCREAYTGAHDWWLRKIPWHNGHVDQWLCVPCQATRLGWVKHETPAVLLGTLIVRR